MICVSIQNKEFPEIQSLLPSLEMAEIRLDRCALSDEEIEQLFSQSDVPLIATCRMAEEPGAPEILERAKKAFLDCGVEPAVKPIRGGTDGARLSFMGLPCPNLSTGGYNFHGRKELIPVQAMEKMVQVLERLICADEG